MKLTEIAIEGSTFSGRVQLGPLNGGLNFIYGENGAGKTHLSGFLRGLLLPGANQSAAATGHTACTSKLGSCVLRQTAGASQPAQIESLQNGHSPVTSLDQITGAITQILSLIHI